MLCPIICIVILHLGTSIINMLAIGRVVHPVHRVCVTLCNNLVWHFLLITPEKEQHEDSNAQKYGNSAKTGNDNNRITSLSLIGKSWKRTGQAEVLHLKRLACWTDWFTADELPLPQTASDIIPVNVFGCFLAMEEQTVFTVTIPGSWVVWLWNIFSDSPSGEGPGAAVSPSPVALVGKVIPANPCRIGSLFLQKLRWNVIFHSSLHLSEESHEFLEKWQMQDEPQDSCTSSQLLPRQASPGSRSSSGRCSPPSQTCSSLCNQLLYIQPLHCWGHFLNMIKVSIIHFIYLSTRLCCRQSSLRFGSSSSTTLSQ